MSSQHRLQDLLRASKHASGLSVRDIAEKAGVSHGTVSNALNNSPRTHPITDEMLHKLATGFGLPFPRIKKAHDQDRAARSEPTKSDDGTDVPSAILADPHLIPEARAHLLNQYQLLLRIQSADPIGAEPGVDPDPEAAADATHDHLDESEAAERVTRP